MDLVVSQPRSQYSRKQLSKTHKQHFDDIVWSYKWDQKENLKKSLPPFAPRFIIFLRQTKLQVAGNVKL